jgi:hypothetical protein
MATIESTNLLVVYELQLEAARKRFADQLAVKTLFSEPMQAASLEAFLIAFTILGVEMTQPVEGWIRRAGQRCGELGLAHLARALAAHAQQEADHHLLMLADAVHLVGRWNARHRYQLNLETLLQVQPTRGVRQYRALHEDTICGSAPYGQLAIEYEIEMLSVTYGPKLIERCSALLHPEILDSLSFLREHVELDVGNTHFNRIQLNQLLMDNPAYVRPLVAAGSAALDAYAVFLGDCLSLLSEAADSCC